MTGFDARIKSNVISSSDIPVLRVGSLVADLPFVLAPMAGYTDLPFRRLARRMGAGWVVTELVSVDGLARNSPATRVMLSSHPEERPCVAHFYGCDPELFARAAAAAEAGGCFAAVDVNAGCPVPKVLKRGAGAGLIRNPDLLCAIVRALKAATTLPVTVKTRIGSSPAGGQMTVDFARRIEDAGADGLALHARYTSARHNGPADWDLIAQVKQALTIPVIGNGGITSAAQAMDALRIHGVDGIMIGRAAIGNPWIFQELRARVRGEAWHPPTCAERRARMAEHLAMQIEWAERELGARRRKKADADNLGARRFRAHLIKYLAGMRGVVDMKRGLNDIASSADVLRAMDQVFAQNPD